MIVVSNTSPLTNLVAIGQLELLPSLFEQIHIPSAVWEELHAGGGAWPGHSDVDAADWVVRDRVMEGPLLTRPDRMWLQRGIMRSNGARQF